MVKNNAEKLVSGLGRISAEDLVQGLSAEKLSIKVRTKRVKPKRDFRIPKKASRLLIKGRDAFFRGAKASVPIIKKQVKLIADQQRRDAAMEKKFAKKKEPRQMQTTKTIEKFVPVKRKGKKKFFKKVRVKVKVPKRISAKKSQDFDPLGNLNF